MRAIASQVHRLVSPACLVYTIGGWWFLTCPIVGLICDVPTAVVHGFAGTIAMLLLWSNGKWANKGLTGNSA